MSAQTMADAFAPVEARYRAQIYEDTWGHLAPSRNKTYKGHIVFAVGCYGNDPLNPTVLECSFSDLDDSPWFFGAMTEFIGREQSNIGKERAFPEGGVYRFDGTFRNYVFKGTFKRVF